jgi:hypothetical protein
LEVEVDAVLAARVGVSQWRSNPMLFRGWAELPKELLAKVLELLQWRRGVCGAVRAVCSAWGDVHDEYCRKLQSRRSAAVMKDKLAWFPSVTEVNLEGCAVKDASAVLAELGSMPSLRSLSLPASCAERAVDAEAVCGITTLTSLRFHPVWEYDDDGNVEEVVVVGEWVLDLSTLTTLTSLHLEGCGAVTAKQVLALSNLTGLAVLNLRCCDTVTAEGLRALSSLTALSTLTLTLSYNPNVTDEVLRSLSSLTALSTLDIYGCHNVTAAGKQALRTAIPNLTIHG